MSEIKSEKLEVNNSAEKIFSFLSNFNNFKSLMPEQVGDWKSTEDTCSFTIQGLPSIGMKIHEKIPFKKIVYTSQGNSPLGFELICMLNENIHEKTETQMIFKANLNPMLSMVASKPLQNFVNILNQKLKDFFEPK